MESSKVYVNVMAEFTNDGRLLPRSFIWKDGHVYEIQKVTDVRRAASLKAGGSGIRYTCIVDGKRAIFSMRTTICGLWRRDSFLMVLYQSKRSARRSQDEWCGLRHIGTHLSRVYNHQWFSFPLSVEWYTNCTMSGGL